MIGLILRRLAQLPLILMVIYTVTLTLAWMIPGNPLENPDGRRPSPEVAEQMLKQYDLDSYPRFYISYLDRLTGLRALRDSISGDSGARTASAADAGIDLPDRPIFDFGPSLQYDDWTVNEIIAGSLPVSVTLGGVAMIIATVLGISAGVIGAVRPNSIADLATLAIALVGISLPSFVIGTVLLLVFAVWIPIFPVAEWGSARSLILPSLTLSLPFAAYIARLTRFGMIEAMQSDYVRTARAKGASETRVLLVHALPNAFLPVLSYLGPATAFAMTGSFVVEKVFNIPGMGQHFVAAVQNKDLFLIMGVVLVFAGMLVVFNLAVDVLYRFVDPRIG